MRQRGRQTDDFLTVFMSKNVTFRCEEPLWPNNLNATHCIFRTDPYHYSDISDKTVTGGHVIQKTSGSSEPRYYRVHFIFLPRFSLYTDGVIVPLKVLPLEAIFIYFLQVHLHAITAGGQILYFMLSKPIRWELFTSLSEVPVNSFMFGAVQTTNRLSKSIPWTGGTRVGVNMERKGKKKRRRKIFFSFCCCCWKFSKERRWIRNFVITCAWPLSCSSRSGMKLTQHKLWTFQTLCIISHLLSFSHLYKIKMGIKNQFFF